MNNDVLIAVVSALGLILSGVLVELARARRRQDTVVSAVTPNHGSSMRDIVGRMETDLRELRAEVHGNTVRLATVEARFSEHLIGEARRRRSDG